MSKVLNFDMDGTFVDLYGVDGWLDDLTNSRTRPYEIAKGLIDLRLFAILLNKAHRRGYTLNVITKTSRSGNAEYHERVKAAKLNWLTKHLPSVHFDNIFVIPYTANKADYAEGILFDDETNNCVQWGLNKAVNVSEHNFLEALKHIINNME